MNISILLLHQVLTGISVIRVKLQMYMYFITHLFMYLYLINCCNCVEKFPITNDLQIPSGDVCDSNQIPLDRNTMNKLHTLLNENFCEFTCIDYAIPTQKLE